MGEERERYEADLFELERGAMGGDPVAMSKVLLAARTLRLAVMRCLSRRYSDGECDASAIYDLRHALEDAYPGSKEMVDR